jgi:hypothetical protein
MTLTNPEVYENHINMEDMIKAQTEYILNYLRITENYIVKVFLAECGLDNDYQERHKGEFMCEVSADLDTHTFKIKGEVGLVLKRVVTDEDVSIVILEKNVDKIREIL